VVSVSCVVFVLLIIGYSCGLWVRVVFGKIVMYLLVLIVVIVDVKVSVVLLVLWCIGICLVWCRI